MESNSTRPSQLVSRSIVEKFGNKKFTKRIFSQNFECEPFYIDKIESRDDCVSKVQKWIGRKYVSSNWFAEFLRV